MVGATRIQNYIPLQVPVLAAHVQGANGPTVTVMVKASAVQIWSAMAVRENLITIRAMFWEQRCITITWEAVNQR